jgi:hypothetical protein
MSPAGSEGKRASGEPPRIAWDREGATIDGDACSAWLKLKA